MKNSYKAFISNDFDSTRDFVSDHLKGWKWLGEGANAVVVAHKKQPDIVIKIGPKTDSGILWLGESYKRWPTNRYYPRVHSLITNENKYIAVLERLKYNKASYRKNSKLLYRIQAYIEGYFANMNGDYWDVDERSDNKRMNRKFEKECTPKQLELLKSFKSIAKRYSAEGISEDLHDENIMFRGEQPVIIDPFHREDGYSDDNYNVRHKKNSELLKKLLELN